MKHNVLGGIVKRVNYKFSMETFQDRLKLQKHIYLLKAFGLDLGYNYNWYLFGPYSPTLTKDGFELVKDTSSSEEVKFQKPENEKRFMEYLKFVDTKKDDANEDDTTDTESDAEGEQSTKAQQQSSKNSEEKVD